MKLVAGSSSKGPYATSSASCQPLSAVHLALTMLSVKFPPNPGFVKIASRSALGIGDVDGFIDMPHRREPVSIAVMA